MLVSGVQQSDSVIHIFFFYNLLQNIEYSSLCYTIGLFWLPILYIVMCIYYLFILSQLVVKYPEVFQATG